MSFWRTYYHIVWTTKNREPMITPEVEPRLFAYIVGKAAELGVYVYAINGWVDHVHLVVAIPPKRSVADVVKMLKGPAHIMSMRSARVTTASSGRRATGFSVWARSSGQRPCAMY